VLNNINMSQDEATITTAATIKIITIPAMPRNRKLPRRKILMILNKLESNKSIDSKGKFKTISPH